VNGDGFEGGEDGSEEGPAPDNGSVSARARDQSRAAGRSGTPDKADRVKFFAELMSRNEFITGVTAKTQARVWGIHEDTAAKDAAEASRLFAVKPEDHEERRARWLAKLEGAQLDARKLARHEALGRLLELEGKAHGFFEAEKHEVKVAPVTLDDLDSLKRSAEANECSGPQPKTNDDEPSS
jgi:hypothetical protein